MSESQNSEQHFNMVLVKGVLAGSPRKTVLASGSVVWNYDLTTSCADGQRRSVPIAWVDPSRPPSLDVGHEVVAVGCIRRRFFRAGGATQSRTELLAEVVARSGSVRATKVLVSFRDHLPER